ncbi:cytochrome c3 family protein [Sphingomonas sp.]|uniref:cytochrome c3 family protein n=1 Tax=Sphingomonas sp. TaxID=28214 RepID=UPI001B26A202|nr:cytochrome c3 family protein [Sphingomonas sp.]MBO9713240.1 cytochrome c3 family protein [Sphingomonas sp.]
MAFLIRHISFTADHREIVRETRNDRAVLGVGRASENDIALPDLSVAPRHAEIESRDGRQLSVRATGTLGFGVDGRITKRAEIDSARGAELAFGGHRITVGRDDAGDITLAVRRVDAISEAEEEREEGQAFSLRGKLPGKRGTAWLLLVAILVGFLAVPIWGFFHKTADDQRSIYSAHWDRSWSSGALSTAHHSLEKNCNACHVDAFVSVRDDACIACHKDVHDHASPARIAGARAAPTAWGRFLRGVADAFHKPGPGACVDCHTEHEGAGPMPSTRQAFCTECHATLDQRLKATRLGNAGDFGTSHPQFQPLVNGARVSLDGHPMAADGLKFSHALHLSTSGGVARMGQTLRGRYAFGTSLDCKDCHVKTADGLRFVPVDFERSCGMCHSLAYDTIQGTVRKLRHGGVAQAIADLRAFYATRPVPKPMGLDGGRRRPGLYAEGKLYSAYFGAVARRSPDAAIAQLFDAGGACQECHTIARGGPYGWEVARVSQPPRYLFHGWFDHEAHKGETCVSCHAAGASGSAEDLLLPGIKTCRTCHGGEGSSAKVPSSCAMCHRYHGDGGAPWAPRRSAREDAIRREGP